MRDTTVRVVMASIVFGFLIFGCAAPPRLTGPDATHGWTHFTNQEVAEIQTAFPTGDLGKHQIRFKDSNRIQIYQ